MHKSSRCAVALVAVVSALGGTFVVGCGGSEVPEAPPGAPINPPQEDPALAEMMAAGTPSPSAAPEPTVSAAPSAPSASPSASSAPHAPSSASSAPKAPPPQPAPKK
jgi:hypothetical protein